MNTMQIGDAESSNVSSTNYPVATLKQKIATTLDFVNHLVIVVLTVLTLAFSARITAWDLHASLCTVGYVLLMAEGIIWLAGDNVVIRPISRRTKKHVHWVLQVLGLICIVAGVVVAYVHKRRHFKSNHAILGLTSLVIMIVLAVFGYPVIAAAKFRKIIKPVIVKFTHNFLGITCFVIGMASQILGYKLYWHPDVPDPALLQLIAIIFSIFIIVCSVRSALPTLVSQFATIVRRKS